jgi:hypothetical protein
VETFPRGTLHPWYVTGLVEGEGSFTYSRSGKQLAVYFTMKRELTLLEDLRSFFGGIGTIYGHGGTTSWRVTHRHDLARLVVHFDRYPLRTKKADSYAVWREMVLLKQQFRKVDRDGLERLACELSAPALQSETKRTSR